MPLVNEPLSKPSEVRSRAEQGIFQSFGLLVGHPDIAAQIPALNSCTIAQAPAE
jgi:hypothetical protein